MIILLTDAAPTGVTPDEVRVAAARAKAAGMLIYTIGLGQDVDHALLADVASKPEWYFFAPGHRRPGRDLRADRVQHSVQADVAVERREADRQAVGARPGRR